MTPRRLVNTEGHAENYRYPTKMYETWAIIYQFIRLHISQDVHLLKVERNFKSQALPLQFWTGTWRSKGSRFPERLDTRHLKVARLSVLSSGRL